MQQLLSLLLGVKRHIAYNEENEVIDGVAPLQCMALACRALLVAPVMSPNSRSHVYAFPFRSWSHCCVIGVSRISFIRFNAWLAWTTRLHAGRI